MSHALDPFSQSRAHCSRRALLEVYLAHGQNATPARPPRIITHTLPLEEAPHGYDIFKHKRDGCVKVVLKP